MWRFFNFLPRFIFFVSYLCALSLSSVCIDFYQVCCSDKLNSSCWTKKILHFNFFPVRFFVGKVFVRSASGSSLLKYLNIFFFYIFFVALFFCKRSLNVVVCVSPESCLWGWFYILFFVVLFLWLIPHHIEDRQPDSRTESTGGGEKKNHTSLALWSLIRRWDSESVFLTDFDSPQGRPGGGRRAEVSWTSIFKPL